MTASNVVGQLRTITYERVLRESIGEQAEGSVIAEEVIEKIIEVLKRRAVYDFWRDKDMLFTDMLTWSTTGDTGAEVCSYLNNHLDKEFLKALKDYENDCF